MNISVKNNFNLPDSVKNSENILSSDLKKSHASAPFVKYANISTQNSYANVHKNITFGNFQDSFESSSPDKDKKQTGVLNKIVGKFRVIEQPRIKSCLESIEQIVNLSNKKDNEINQLYTRIYNLCNKSQNSIDEIFSLESEGEKILSDFLRLISSDKSYEHGYQEKKLSNINAELKGNSNSAKKSAKKINTVLSELDKNTSLMDENINTLKLISISARRVKTSSEAEALLKSAKEAMDNINSIYNYTSSEVLSSYKRYDGLKQLCEKSKSLLKESCKIYMSTDSDITGYVYPDLNYDDDRVIAIDPSYIDAREDIRTNIQMSSGLSDEALQVVNLDRNVESQLPYTSKYFHLGELRPNLRDGRKVFICENLKEMPDKNGVRGKTPLSGKNNALKWRLSKIKDVGITTIIDLRAEGECSNRAKTLMSELGLKYLNFPVEDENWTEDSLYQITDYINAVNEGDFYVGCANGESRTDTAVAINYLFNPQAKNVPVFYFGNPSSTRVSAKQNVIKIINLISKNSDIIYDWGWKDYSQFWDTYSKRYNKIFNN